MSHQNDAICDNKHGPPSESDRVVKHSCDGGADKEAEGKDRTPQTGYDTVRCNVIGKPASSVRLDTNA